jgi:3-hydroxy-3-methylglutaryl CoA synthase
VKPPGQEAGEDALRILTMRDLGYEPTLTLDRLDTPVDFDRHFAAHVYHAPFGGMTFRAHRALFGHWKPLDRSAAWEPYRRKELPSLMYIRRMGGTYAASTLIGMLFVPRFLL